jgi:alkanesulfonate monooxygenase SsuD/methylene tetrahydromethanopterin reductase-like flavin-dependent oxidoreductase (luciferase family)
MMAFAVVGPNQAAIDAATRRVQGMFGGANVSPEQWREGAKARGMIVGGTEEVVDALGRLAALGVQEVQFQHFNFDSDEVPEYLAAEIAPKVRAL